MIHSKVDLIRFLEADRAALRIHRTRPHFFGDEVWKFQRALRYVEYLSAHSSPFNLLLLAYHKFRLHRLAVECDFTISPYCFEEGLSIAHRGTIIVNAKARIGKNCRINAGVVVGASGGDSEGVPTLGNNVYIGPGAKIFGNIVIADDVAIGANAVVNKSFLEAGITIAGIPARKINDHGSAPILQKPLINFCTRKDPIFDKAFFGRGRAFLLP